MSYQLHVTVCAYSQEEDDQLLSVSTSIVGPFYTTQRAMAEGDKLYAHFEKIDGLSVTVCLIETDEE